MSLIMEAWRERGYAPPGSERMLQDYEDKLELEQNKRDLIYALQYPPAPPPPSPEDIRNEIYARIYPPSNGPAPQPELEDLPDGTLGVAGDVHAIRKVLDAGGVQHYLPFRHNSIVIGLPDVAKVKQLLGGQRQSAESNPYASPLLQPLSGTASAAQQVSGAADVPVDDTRILSDGPPDDQVDTRGMLGQPIADASGVLRQQADALRQGWNRQGWSVMQGARPITYDLANTTRNFLGGVSGYDSAQTAQAAFAQGNYGVAAVEGAKSLLEAGTTVFGGGAGGNAAMGMRKGGMTASELAAARATYPKAKPADSSMPVPGVEYATVNGRKVYPQTYKELYHGTDNATLGLPSSMSPNDVAQHLFANGLPARGANTDLIAHALNNAPDRAYRGTTTAPFSQERNAGAAYWAGDGGLVIEIKGAAGYDVNAALEGRVLEKGGYYGDNPRFGEQEIAVPGAMRPEQISRIGVPVVNEHGVQKI